MFLFSSRVRATLIVALGLTACGDDDPDAGLDGSVMFDAGMPDCFEGALLVTTSNFSEAEVATVDRTTGAVEVAPSLLSDQDTLPDSAGCVPVLMERAAGQLVLHDPATPLSATGSVDLNPPGATAQYAANPQKVVHVSATKAYVVLQAVNQILVVDPTRPVATAIVGTIDLSGFLDPDDPDGRVDQTDAVLVGNRVFVGLGNFWFDSSFAQQFEGSVLAVIDTATDTVVDADSTVPGVQGVELAFNNPWRGMVYDAFRNELLVGATGGSFGVIDGGIEAIDLSTLTSLGSVLSETDLGAEISGFALPSSGRLVVLSGGELKSFERSDLPPSGTLPSSLLWATGVSGMEAAGEEVVVWETNNLRIFNAFAQDVTPGGSPISVGTYPIYGVAAF